MAVHGYAGFIGLVICGFVLWGYPSSPFDGYASISPWGNTAGAIIMFWVLGFLPCFVVAKILQACGILRIPIAVEIAGLDLPEDEAVAAARASVREGELQAARDAGLLS